MKDKKNFLTTLLILVVALTLGVFVAIDYISFRYEETYFSFTEGYDKDTHEYRSIQTLGEYSPKLSKYGADTKIYIIASEEAQAQYEKNKANGEASYKGCASALILGGTHANEPSGQLTATIFLENAHVSGNTVLFIITETNRSAFSYSFPQEGAVTHYTLTNKSGSERTFKYGTRATNPVDQWPNPDIYQVSRVTPNGVTYSTKLSSTDSRNINRAYGVSDPVTYTEKVAYGITNLIKENDIKVAFDLHEASPEYQTINAIVFNNSDNTEGVDTEKQYYAKLTGKIALAASKNLLSDQKVEIGQNQSPESLRGLTHIELGTYTDALVFLCETSNASQGKLRGAFTEFLVTYEGEGYQGDLYYERFNDTKILYANAVSLSERVARHTMTILEIFNQYNLSLTNGNAENNLTKTRSDILKDCGNIDVSLDLYTSNSTGENKVDDYYKLENYVLAQYDPFEPIKGSPQASQAFELIYTYGVGYFLKDNK